MDTSNNTQMEAAIAHLNRQESLNYAAAARVYGVHSQTLARRHKGLTMSRTEANSTFRQRLNNSQEDTILSYIDTLTETHIPPTTQIIKNLAEEILKGL
jgi:hypothetical protein